MALILHQITNADYVSGSTVNSVVGPNGTISGAATVNADSISLDGSSGNVATPVGTMPLGEFFGGTTYRATDHSMLFEVELANLAPGGFTVGSFGRSITGVGPNVFFNWAAAGKFNVQLYAIDYGPSVVTASYASVAIDTRYKIYFRYYAGGPRRSRITILDNTGAVLSDDTADISAHGDMGLDIDYDVIETQSALGYLDGRIYQIGFWTHALEDSELADPFAVELDAVTVSNAGGTRLDLYTDQLEDGQYLVFIGPNGDTTDTPAYPITRGAGRVVQVTDGYFTVVTPVLPIGGPYLMTFDAVSTGANSNVSTEFLTVVPRNFTSSTFSLRRNMFQQASAGALNLLDVPYPQE